MKLSLHWKGSLLHLQAVHPVPACRVDGVFQLRTSMRVLAEANRKFFYSGISMIRSRLIRISGLYKFFCGPCRAPLLCNVLEYGCYESISDPHCLIRINTPPPIAVKEDSAQSHAGMRTAPPVWLVASGACHQRATASNIGAQRVQSRRPQRAF